MNLGKPHMPSVVTCAVLVLVAIILYHVLLGRK